MNRCIRCSIALGMLVCSLLTATAATALERVSWEVMRERIEIAQSKKEFNRDELEAMLATTPGGPFLCPTGEIWPAFMLGAPHSPSTVRLLLRLQGEQKDSWKRYHLISALSVESEAFLRPFWLGLLRQKKLPDELISPVAGGLTRVGTDDDIRELLPKMDASARWRYAVLYALLHRPIAEGLTPATSVFRDSSLSSWQRLVGLRVILRIDPRNRRMYLAEAMAGDEIMQKGAAQLSEPARPAR